MVTTRQIENITLALAAWGGGKLVAPFEELLRERNAIKEIAQRGGEVSIHACDMLNPACGYDAVARWPNGSRNGAELRGTSGMYENGQDRIADPLEALSRLSLLVVGK